MVKELMVEPAIIAALLAVFGVIVGHWVKRLADREAATLEEKTRAQNHEIESVKTVNAGFSAAIDALTASLEAQKKRIKHLDERQKATEEALLREQGSRKEQAQLIAVLKVDRDGLVDYAQVLRDHIVKKLPPPPPDWPGNHRYAPVS